MVICEMWRLPVISSHGHVVTRSTHHRSTHNRSTRHWSTHHTSTSSHSQLFTSEHITKPPVVIFLSARQSDSTQKQCSTRMAYLRQACNIEVTDDGEALEWDECQVKKDGQPVTTPSDTTVTSSHDFTMWRVDRVTRWLVPNVKVRKVTCEMPCEKNHAKNP